MQRVEVLRSFRESFGENEITIKTVDPVSLHLIALDGRHYAEMDDHSIVRVDGSDPLPVRFYTTASHGGGLTLKPRFVYLDGAWRSAIDGSRETGITKPTSLGNGSK